MSIVKNKPKNFQFLQQLQTPGSNESNLGGAYSLPLEFDRIKFASAFVQKGNDVKAHKGPQQVLGTGYVAEGWQVWKYPDKTEDGEPHPQAGKTHEVTEKGKDGQTFVLMFRDMGIQNEVNIAYGQLSRGRMLQEVSGQTVAGANISDDPGMLGEGRLPHIHGDIQEGDQFEPPANVDGQSLPASQIIRKKKQTLTR